VDGALFIAVSDGAGSAPLSRLGSKCSVQTGIAVAKSVERSLRTVHEADLDVVASHVISRIQLELCHLARTVDEPLQSFACTVILVVIFDTHGLVLQVGDGAVVAEDADGSTYLLSRPDHGEYLNETSFVTSCDALMKVQKVLCRQPLRRVAALTDGLERLALNMQTWEPHQPFFEPLFHFAGRPHASTAELAAFLNSERVNGLTDDDKTLVLAIR